MMEPVRGSNGVPVNKTPENSPPAEGKKNAFSHSVKSAPPAAPMLYQIPPAGASWRKLDTMTVHQMPTLPEEGQPASLSDVPSRPKPSQVAGRLPERASTEQIVEYMAALSNKLRDPKWQDFFVNNAVRAVASYIGSHQQDHSKMAEVCREAKQAATGFFNELIKRGLENLPLISFPESFMESLAWRSQEDADGLGPYALEELASKLASSGEDKQSLEQVKTFIFEEIEANAKEYAEQEAKYNEEVRQHQEKLKKMSDQLKTLLDENHAVSQELSSMRVKTEQSEEKLKFMDTAMAYRSAMGDAHSTAGYAAPVSGKTSVSGYAPASSATPRETAKPLTLDVRSVQRPSKAEVKKAEVKKAEVKKVDDYGTARLNASTKVLDGFLAEIKTKDDLSASFRAAESSKKKKDTILYPPTFGEVKSFFQFESKTPTADVKKPESVTTAGYGGPVPAPLPYPMASSSADQRRLGASAIDGLPDQATDRQITLYLERLLRKLKDNPTWQGDVVDHLSHELAWGKAISGEFDEQPQTVYYRLLGPAKEDCRDVLVTLFQANSLDEIINDTGVSMMDIQLIEKTMSQFGANPSSIDQVKAFLAQKVDPNPVINPHVSPAVLANGFVPVPPAPVPQARPVAAPAAATAAPVAPKAAAPAAAAAPKKAPTNPNGAAKGRAHRRPGPKR